jgi:hypothetical protein
MSSLFPLAAPLLVITLAGFGIWRSIRRMRSLEGEERALTRDTMVFSFAGTVSISLAGLAYLLWSYNRSGVLLISAIFSAAVFLVSVIWIARLSFRWSELMLRKKRHSA